MANLAPDQLQPVNSWLEAVQNSKGYEDASLMNNLIEQFESNLTNRLTKKSVIELNQRQVHLLLAFLKIAPVGGACVRVGDFGGGNGYMCDFLRNSNPNFKIDYDVYETAEIAKNYNRHSEKLEINFLDIKTFGKIKYDLVILSCTLQYINNNALLPLQQQMSALGVNDNTLVDYNKFIGDLNSTLQDINNQIAQNKKILARQKDKYNAINSDYSYQLDKINKLEKIDKVAELNVGLLSNYQSQKGYLRKIYPVCIFFLMIGFIYLTYLTYMKFKDNVWAQYKD